MPLPTLPKFRFGRPPLWGAAILLLGFAYLPHALTAQVETRNPGRSRKAKNIGRPTLHQELDFEFIDVNEVLLVIDNSGRIGFDERINGGIGFFPANTPNNYVFGTGLWVGGVVNGTKQVSQGYDFAGGTSEFTPGRADGSGGDQILCSNNPEDLAQWYPEFSDPATGEPVVFSAKDCVVIYNDSNQQRDIKTPIGLEVRQRTMAFTTGRLSQVVFVVWDIVNTGSNTLEEAFVGISADMDIDGGFGGATDDRCSAIPLVPPGRNNPTFDTLATNLGFCWDEDFDEVGFDPNPPGFVGITFFQGPVDANGDTLDLTRFTLVTNVMSSRPQPDPFTDAEAYDLLAGIGTRAPFVDVLPADMRFVEISGPITLGPGGSQRVAAGYVWADVSHDRRNLDVSSSQCFPQGSPCFLPDPNDPALEELIQVQRAAQVIFDKRFLLPQPPPKPDITLIPGDKQVTIVWSDVSQVPDPFFELTSDPTSGSFDPTFRQFDFEGFVLVRSTSGLTDDVDTLAIFDVVNDVVLIADTTFKIFSFVDTVDGDTILAEQPADITPILALPNLGLEFSFVDRGLINGILYFYDVVPFDFNPSNTLRGPDISLSAGISFQPREVKSVRPRSDASSFKAARARFEALKADGSVCDTDEPTATIDPATGHYLDLLDCSNAVVQVEITPLRDLNLPSGEFSLVVDSILPSPTFPYSAESSETGEVGYAIAEGNNVVWYHWEDGAGQPATTIQPTVGSFEQTPRFTHFAETALAFDVDTRTDDLGPDLSLGLVVASSFSVFEDLEVEGRSLTLLELGGTDTERRPHEVVGSSLADRVFLSFDRTIGEIRDYAHPAPYAPGGASFELTWEVSGGTYGGTLRRLPGGEIVPLGGQAKGPTNPSTPADFVAGYNWGFIATGPLDAVLDAIYPEAAPLTNTIQLLPGDTFGILIPGHSIYLEAIRDLPENGERWTFRIDAGSDRFALGELGREPSDVEEGPFSYADVNDGGDELVPFSRGVVNVYPGARWRLSLTVGSNDPVDADLSRIKTVPNPYFANAPWDFSQDDQRLEFTNLPPVATIRIYTISGNLVRVLEHTNGSGTEVWDLQTRFRLKAASGHYYWVVTTPDGRQKIGLMSIIQGTASAN